MPRYSSATPPTNAGEHVVNVLCETATHIYTGHANFKIEPKSISNMLQPITGTYVYSGAPQKPTAVVMGGTKTLVKGTDYTVRYGTNVHVFEAATVYVDGIGNYTGTFSRNFKIQPKPIDITSVVAVDRDYEKDNVDVDHTVTVALKDKATTAWADGTTTDKTYTFTIKRATPTGEPAYTKITTSGKKLSDAALTTTGGTFSVPGTVQ